MTTDTKELILITSQKLFARFGLNKTTVDEIAKIAHVAKGTIYHYFKSKEELFMEVIEKEAILLQNEIRNSIDAAKSPQEKLRAFVLTRFKHLKELVNYYSALKDEYLSHYSFIDNARKKNFDEEIKIVANILKEGIKKNIFDIENVNLTALAIVTALKGLEYPWTIETPLQDIEKNINTLLKVLFKGIEVR
ncbi:MAG: TetR/AcrR family transcriptional regulator [Ignavibacterium sp.]